MARNFLDVDERAITGMALALKQVDKEAKKEWAKAMRTTGTRVWRSAVDKRKRIPQDRIFGRAALRWSQGAKGTAVVAVKPLSGGLEWPLLIDHGAKNGNPRLPRYTRTGRVVGGAMIPFGKYMGQMALKTTADLIRDNVGGT